MKSSAIILVLAAAMAFGACHHAPPPAPPPPPPVAPEAPPPAPPPPPEVKPQVDEYTRLKAMSADEIDRMGLLADIYFELDKSDIRDSERATLAKNADVLKKFDFLKITLEGHCDERGTVEYNLALGERRAKAAYDYLVSLGVPADGLLREGGPGLHRAHRGLLAEEPPGQVHGLRQDRIDGSDVPVVLRGALLRGAPRI
jgi:peptidoglycan-associated lipoprotein